MAPEATLCQVKVLDQTGSGLLSDAIAGVIYAADANVDVINMSFGAYFTLRDPDFRQIKQDFQRAVNYAHRKGVTLVAAAGSYVGMLVVDRLGVRQRLSAVEGVGHAHTVRPTVVARHRRSACPACLSVIRRPTAR